MGRRTALGDFIVIRIPGADRSVGMSGRSVAGRLREIRSVSLPGRLQVLFELLERLREVLAAEADAERVEPVPVEGSRRKQDARLLDEIGTEIVNRPLASTTVGAQPFSSKAPGP